MVSIREKRKSLVAPGFFRYSGGVLTTVCAVLMALLQSAGAGTVVGIVKLPNSDKPVQGARVVLLPPNYVETWNKQVQQRLDNYWETFKPAIFANKDHYADVDRVAHEEAMNSVVSTMRRELGSAANQFIKQASATGQFEFPDVPFGTYQILIQAAVDGRDFLWARPVHVRAGIPIFVDLGKPLS